MKQPLLRGRKLPRNDWEGDDFTPGANGSYVTCMDTAAGRMVAYATNGRIDKDGRVYRASISYNPNGITLEQARTAVYHVAKLPLLIPNWTWEKYALPHLRNYGGLMIAGMYDAFPRSYRYQLKADFAHEIWVSHYSSTSGCRVWDALNPDTNGYGRWMPASIVRKFAESLGGRFLLVGYVPLQSL